MITLNEAIQEWRLNTGKEFSKVESLLRDLINEKKCFLQAEIGMTAAIPENLHPSIIDSFNLYINLLLRTYESDKFIKKMRVKEFENKFDNRYDGVNKQNMVIMIYNYDRIVKIEKMLNENK